MSKASFSDILAQLADGRDFSRAEAKEALGFIVRGEVNEAQTAAFLFGMRQKGETTDELTGFTEAMRAAMVPVQVDTESAVDLCGTGGDHSGTFNISTAAMFVTAGAGVPVLKHGNRSISSKSGSYDVLEALGIVPALPAEKVERCFSETGMAFMFAPLFHPAMKYVMPARRALAMRTFFNIMGPLLNPAGVRRQVIGAYDLPTAEMCARILSRLGAESAVTVHACDGMDEFTTAEASDFFRVEKGRESGRTRFHPEELGIETATHKDLKGGDKDINAAIILSILKGNASPAQRDIVLLNAAFAISVSGKASGLPEALEMARESIGTGAALKKLQAMKETTQELKDD